MFVLTRFTCGNRGKIPCVLVLTCAVAVATEWLISHHCLLRSENLFLAIKIHVVFWMDWILCLERCSSRGAVNRSKIKFKMGFGVVHCSYYDKIYLQLIDMGGLRLQQAIETNIQYWKQV